MILSETAWRYRWCFCREARNYFGPLAGSVKCELVILCKGKREGSSDGLNVGCRVRRKEGKSLLN